MSSYRVLALKWRPQRFADVAGQSHISKTLSNALQTGRAAHAYLFTGPRGVGKTSMARVLAKAFNCEEGLSAEPCGRCGACLEITQGSALDVIEIDGASNRGIDDIRELREGVRYAPARLRRKIYIIDEVHMLTSEAFNALLKTLEEPPDHVVFVLATTEVLKVPQTILSRCQRFDFARLRSAEAVTRLAYICEQEGIPAEADALQLIAVKGEGSMRDALTLLDQVAATGERPITSDVVRRALGITGRELYFSWTTAVREGRTAELLASLGQAVDSGANLVELGEEFLLHLRNLLLVATDPGLSTQIECTEDERTAYRNEAERFETADLLRFCRVLMEAVGQMRRSGFPRVHLEVALAEMSVLPRAIDLRRFVDAVRQRVPEDPVPPSLEAGGESLPKGGSASPAVSGRRGREALVAPAEPAAPAEVGAPARHAAPDEVGAPPGHAAPEEAGAPGGHAAPDEVGAPPGHAAPDARVASTAPVAPEPHLGNGAALDTQPAADPWLDALAEIAAEKPPLQGFLAGARATLEREDTLRISIPSKAKIYLDLLQARDNRRIVTLAVQRAYGRPLGVRFEATAPAPVALAPVAPGVEGAERPAAGGGIQRIIDLFDGDVLGPA